MGRDMVLKTNQKICIEQINLFQSVHLRNAPFHNLPCKPIAFVLVTDCLSCDMAGVGDIFIGDQKMQLLSIYRKRKIRPVWTPTKNPQVDASHISEESMSHRPVRKVQGSKRLEGSSSAAELPNRDSENKLRPK